VDFDSFIITITLSAADATAHIVENPFTPGVLRHQIGISLVLVAFLGACGILATITRLRGFTDMKNSVSPIGRS